LGQTGVRTVQVPSPVPNSQSAVRRHRGSVQSQFAVSTSAAAANTADTQAFPVGRAAWPSGRPTCLRITGSGQPTYGSPHRCPGFIKTAFPRPGGQLPSLADPFLVLPGSLPDSLSDSFRETPPQALPGGLRVSLEGPPLRVPGTALSQGQRRSCFRPCFCGTIPSCASVPDLYGPRPLRALPPAPEDISKQK
jgi:hypothetical protein